MQCDKCGVEIDKGYSHLKSALEKDGETVFILRFEVRDGKTGRRRVNLCSECLFELFHRWAKNDIECNPTLTELLESVIYIRDKIEKKTAEKQR